eukprot:scaffold99275_cov36-Phaeocystis_antarctica.AAC.1
MRAPPRARAPAAPAGCPGRPGRTLRCSGGTRRATARRRWRGWGWRRRSWWGGTGCRWERPGRPARRRRGGSG